MTQTRAGLLSNQDIAALAANLLVGSSAGGAPIGLTADQAVTLLKTGVAATGMLQSKIAPISRDMSLASSSVAYTGVGFKPSALIYIANVPNTQSCSWGMVASDKTATSFTPYYANAWSITTGGMFAYDLVIGPGNSVTGTVSSFDSDGFTISWVKAGSPLATMYFNILCLR